MDYALTIVKPGRTIRVLTDEGVDKFTELKLARVPDKEIAKTLGVPLNSVRGKAQTLKLTVQSNSSWSLERIDLLKKLWADGLSASQIAMRLGYVTRNAVIGKVTRLGLPSRKCQVRSKAVRHQPRPRTWTDKRISKVEQVHTSASFVSDALPPEPPKPDKLFKLVDLEDNQCRFPFGDPKSKDFGFCGCVKAAGSSYCPGHARLATNAVQPADRSRAPVRVIRRRFNDDRVMEVSL